MNDEEDPRTRAPMPQYPPYPPYPPFPPYPPVVIMGCCHGNGHGSPFQTVGQAGVAGDNAFGNRMRQLQQAMNIDGFDGYDKRLEEQLEELYRERAKNQREQEREKLKENGYERDKPAPTPAATGGSPGLGLPPPPPPINPLDPVGSIYNVVNWLFGGPK